MNRLTQHLNWLEDRASLLDATERLGRVAQVTGLIIESEGPDLALGELCEIRSSKNATLGIAEVVGFRENRVLLMPLEDIYPLHPGCRVAASDRAQGVPLGNALLGRVIDGLGRPLDTKGPLLSSKNARLNASAPNPLKRKRVSELLKTGIKAIDVFTPLGLGQRVGIFAGSGVGKSTLLGMMAKGSSADINVIALVGERGRELRDFIEGDLGEEGLAKTVVVVSTSDQAAPLRLRAALMATTIAESFRDSGKNVLFMMDSITRFAMAQRELGLSIGEPPTARGYTPSVFSLLPKLLERTGMGEKGSITALYTVLVEGDDLNEPITDAVRGIVDGHIILSRKIATANHYPAIDILESLSRLSSTLLTEEESKLAGKARDLLALYRQSEDLIQVGAYVPNTNPKLDFAIKHYDALMQFLKQGRLDYQDRYESFEDLKKIIQ